MRFYGALTALLLGVATDAPGQHVAITAEGGVATALSSQFRRVIPIPAPTSRPVLRYEAHHATGPTIGLRAHVQVRRVGVELSGIHWLSPRRIENQSSGGAVADTPPERAAISQLAFRVTADVTLVGRRLQLAAGPVVLHFSGDAYDWNPNSVTSLAQRTVWGVSVASRTDVVRIGPVRLFAALSDAVYRVQLVEMAADSTRAPVQHNLSLSLGAGWGLR